MFKKYILQTDSDCHFQTAVPHNIINFLQKILTRYLHFPNFKRVEKKCIMTSRSTDYAIFHSQDIKFSYFDCKVS